MSQRILVYGTLRKGNHANWSLKKATFLSEVRVPGFDMFSLGHFPGIKKRPDNKLGIVGEIYEIPDEEVDNIISHLDYYEGYFPDNKARSLYLREEIDVEGHPTMLYVYNGQVEEKWVEPIASGDWKDANV